jgi:multidrug efflux pump subunit AcrA (membrane-fusion protein)
VAVSLASDGVLATAGQVLATLESSAEKATVALAAARARTESAMKANQIRLDFGITSRRDC